MTSLNLAIVKVTSAGLTTATTAYTAGDTLGSLNTLTIPSSKTDALILGVVVTDKTAVLGAITIHPYTASVTFGTDNAAPSISDADNLLALPTIVVPPLVVTGTGTLNRKASLDSLSVPIHADASSQVFFGVVTETGHTFFGAVGDVQYAFLLSLDV